MIVTAASYQQRVFDEHDYDADDDGRDYDKTKTVVIEDNIEKLPSQIFSVVAAKTDDCLMVLAREQM